MADQGPVPQGEHAPVHHLVYHHPDHWAAVPANNGGNGPTWQWGDELLVGFTVGRFKQAEWLHQCSYEHPFENWLARSPDGGETWQAWKPEGYAGRGGNVRPCNGGLDFTAAGFVMRVEGNAYHGNSGCRWFCSHDRGRTWQGPYGFGDLLAHPELADRQFTGRTACVVEGRHELLLFLSVRATEADGLPESPFPAELLVRLREKTFVARTTDGGRTFDFVSWVVPWRDPSRAAMPAPARLSPTELVVALRRKSPTSNWIDCYGSDDGGLMWAFLSKVGDTEDGSSFNGNPPALIRRADGRLCCAYGNRSARGIITKCSDDGRRWAEFRVLRDDFHSANGLPDLGYVRLFARVDGKLVAVYFWCTAQRPQTHIEATVFE